MKNLSKRPGSLLALALVLAVWISPRLESAASAQTVDEQTMTARYEAQRLRVNIWHNKDQDQVFRRGENLQVTIQTNEDAYAVLYRIDVDGRVDILWPTSRFSDGFVFGGHQYRLPAADGDRLRVGDEEGVGYLQVVVSLYPFDLRDLPLDFFHERGGQTYDFYVAGDPYLAMNEVNFEVTGLEDPSEFVITNHASYYVHRKVDHPRYLCSQCHDGPVAQEPYRTTCTVNIHYDHGWMNQWWVSYGYFPAYYYPVYYYVDPWTGYRWVNYWYDPWYWWPPRSFYSWPYYCYDWRYSPYWTWDSRVAYQRGNRRYTPLNRGALDRERSVAMARTKNALVTEARPAEDRLRAMKQRTAIRDDQATDDRARIRQGEPAGGEPRNVQPAARAQERYTADSRVRTSPGLRVPGGSGETRTQRPEAPTGTSRDERGDRGRQLEPRQAGGREAPETRQQVRPVEPRTDGARVWTNRRNTPAADPRPTTPATRPQERDSAQPRTVAPARRDDARSRSESSGAQGVRGGTRGSNVQRPSAPPAQPAAPPPPAVRPGGNSGGSRSESTGQRSESTGQRSSGNQGAGGTQSGRNPGGRR